MNVYLLVKFEPTLPLAAHDWVFIEGAYLSEELAWAASKKTHKENCEEWRVHVYEVDSVE